MSSKVHFISLGCPKNLVDSEIMAGTLLKDGFEVVGDEGLADTVIINTCGFIDASKQESIQRILEMSELKKQGKLNRVVVSGCLTQRYKSELVESLPEADIFVGSGEFQRINEILKENQTEIVRKEYFDHPTFLQKTDSPRVNSQPTHRAYLKISEGCMKRCSFCAIPLIRGNLQSREVSAIVNEAKLLAIGGVQELIIISHDFTDYGWDLRKQDSTKKDSPITLLRELSQVEGIKWIRLLYLYPDGITKEMIELFKTQPKLIPYFDMPLQHVNDEMLKRMNRKMTRNEIEAVLHMIRSELPEAIIRTQFIVGFPGETDEQFSEIIEFINKHKFDRVGCFQYSPEENTPGGKMENQLDAKTKQKRWDQVMQVAQKISQQKLKNYIGKEIEVVVEGYSEETELLLQGRYWGQAPEIDGVILINEGEAQLGEFIKVRVTESMDYDLIGSIVE